MKTKTFIHYFIFFTLMPYLLNATVIKNNVGNSVQGKIIGQIILKEDKSTYYLLSDNNIDKIDSEVLQCKYGSSWTLIHSRKNRAIEEDELTRIINSTSSEKLNDDIEIEKNYSTESIRNISIFGSININSSNTNIAPYIEIKTNNGVHKILVNEFDNLKLTCIAMLTLISECNRFKILFILVYLPVFLFAIYFFTKRNNIYEFISVPQSESKSYRDLSDSQFTKIETTTTTTYTIQEAQNHIITISQKEFILHYYWLLIIPLSIIIGSVVYIIITALFFSNKLLFSLFFIINLISIILGVLATVESIQSHKAIKLIIFKRKGNKKNWRIVRKKDWNGFLKSLS